MALYPRGRVLRDLGAAVLARSMLGQWRVLGSARGELPVRQPYGRFREWRAGAGDGGHCRAWPAEAQRSADHYAGRAAELFRNLGQSPVPARADRTADGCGGHVALQLHAPGRDRPVRSATRNVDSVRRWCPRRSGRSHDLASPARAGASRGRAAAARFDRLGGDPAANAGGAGRRVCAGGRGRCDRRAGG